MTALLKAFNRRHTAAKGSVHFPVLAEAIRSGAVKLERYKANGEEFNRLKASVPTPK